MKEKQLNINQATLDELISINGIGAQLAKRIVEGRPYDNMHDLVKVSGINEVKLASLDPFFTTEEKPVKNSQAEKSSLSQSKKADVPFIKTGDTEAFLFLENRNERQDALLIIFGGFILGLLILFLRRSKA
ncbi:MAG: ComEA family DNA-binding protein [Anaerolineales bacterium]|jgi:NAD-dependent DNA ligase